MRSVELISNIIPVLHPLDTGAKALQFMNEYHVAHLAMVVDGEYLGLVREEEILDWDNPDYLLETLSYAHFRPAVQADSHFFEALKLCSDFKLSALPVINPENKFLGMISRENLLHAVAMFNGVKEAGGLILLEMDPKDYQLSEIARIAESNEVNILSVNTLLDPALGKLEVLIKTNRLNMQPLVSTFERFDYTIKHLFSHQEEELDLKRNYDLLMNYLNM
ncbi:MAG: CBS domain-containing protein [Chitinophagaceae bacterium]